MPIDRLILAAALALAPLAAPLPAQAQDTAPRAFVTRGQGTFGTTRVAYEAAEEEFILPSPDGKAAASVFATSYLKAGGKTAKPDPTRPVLFVFNGGPGSASLWLHMGLLGPQRIDFDDPDHPQTTAPFHTVANADSPLDVADLVLIDPPGTGYSRILADGTPAMFYGVEQDAVATVQVMEQWLARHGRMNAPKYILSESYGTVRAAVVARLLAGGPTQTGQMDGISLNGVILLGQAMDMAHGGVGDDRGYLGILPSLAATACHFHKVAPDCTPQGQADAAQAFVDDTYLGALHAGSRLAPRAALPWHKPWRASSVFPPKRSWPMTCACRARPLPACCLQAKGGAPGFTMPASPCRWPPPGQTRWPMTQPWRNMCPASSPPGTPMPAIRSRSTCPSPTRRLPFAM
jgi:carboxypeptidase C (cathepsin A)